MHTKYANMIHKTQSVPVTLFLKYYFPIEKNKITVLFYFVLLNQFVKFPFNVKTTNTTNYFDINIIFYMIII